MRLQADNVSFSYGKTMAPVLEHVNFSVQSGQRMGLVAPSGYGKSTLALLLAGFLRPTEGRILLDGSSLPGKGLCPVQLIYQHPEKAINPRWRLRQVLEESGPVEPELLEALGIREQWLRRYPRELSGGELQRFCVARALMSRPDFLICDEISTMLDGITQAQIWNVILDRTPGTGLVIVTHNMALANRICTDIYDLQQETQHP